MNEEKNFLTSVDELLKDEKMLTCLVGLGICTPFIFPSYATFIPVVSSLLVKCGYAAIGGVATYVSMDALGKIIKK